MKKTLRKASLLCSAALLISSMSVFPQPDKIGAAESEIYYTEGFNSGAGGWTGRGDASAAQTDSEVYEGKGALSVTGRGDSWNGCSYDVSSESWFSAGSDLSFSAAVYNSGRSDMVIMLSLQYSDGSTVYDHIAQATIPSKSWGTVGTSSYTVPSGSGYSLYFETKEGTSSFIVDDIMIGSAGAVNAVSITPGESAGDLNGDGVVNIADMVILKSQILAPKSATYMSDINADGSLDTNDFVYMFGYFCGAYQSLPMPVKPEVPQEEEHHSDYQYNKDISFREIPGNYFNAPANGGKITKESYNGINGGNSCNVYTPPGYDPSQKYNIFYLMHGGEENENTLFYQDDTNIKPVLDNMINNGEIDPMIVVTPTFNKTEAGKFYSEFRQSLVPFIEGKYSTYAESTDQAGLEASRMHRAYGGFSMGGVSTWAVMENCLDIVAYFMPLSGDHWNGNSAYDKAKSIANAVDKSGYADKFYIFCATGSTDIAYPNVSPQIDEMKKMSQFKYTADFSQGNLYFLVVQGKDHWWGNVRHYVYDGLPNFFREY